MGVDAPVVGVPFARVSLVGRRMRVSAFGTSSGLRWKSALLDAGFEVPASGLSRITSTCLGFQACPDLFEAGTLESLSVKRGS